MKELDLWLDFSLLYKCAIGLCVERKMVRFETLFERQKMRLNFVWQKQSIRPLFSAICLVGQKEWVIWVKLKLHRALYFFWVLDDNKSEENHFLEMILAHSQRI